MSSSVSIGITENRNNVGVSILETRNNVAVAISETKNDVNITVADSVTVSAGQPFISGAEIADDNTYINLFFSEAMYNTNGVTGALETTDLSLTFAANGGTATGASITSVKQLDGDALAGGEIGIRVNISVTGDVSGTETITLKPVADSIYDAEGNVISTSESAIVTLNQLTSAEAQAVFNLMNTDPDATLKEAMKVLIDAEVANGNWDLYRQVVFFGMDTAANSVTDWKGNQNALTVNSPVHSPYSGPGHSGFAGYLFDGATNYVNTQKAPSTMTDNNMAFESWVFDNLSGTDIKMLIGCSDGTKGMDIFQGSAGKTVARIDSGTQAQTTEAKFSDHTLYAASRSSNIRLDIYKNGVSLGNSVSSDSVSPSIASIFISARNNNGTADLHLNARLCFYIAHQAVGFDFAAAYTNWLTFLQTLGIEA